MPQVTLNLHLPSQLLFDVRCLQVRLVQDFESHDEPGGAFPRKVDVSEFALAQWLAHLKVFEGPDALRRCCGLLLLLSGFG